MILVTCAGGKTGRAIVPALAKAGQNVRAMVGRPESAASIAGLGAAEIVSGALTDADAVASALQGVDAIYYIAPNMTPDERLIGDIVIDAAKAAGVKRFIFHSTLHTQIEALPHHWERHFVEQSLINSGLAYTILQCGSYMQNMLPGWAKMVETGVHSMAYDIDAPMSLVDLDDIAELAVKVSTEPGYENAIFEICGAAITLRQKAEILANVLGIPIRAEKEQLRAFLDHGRALGFSDFALATMAKMFPYYDAHGLVGNGKILGWILGREPTGFESFVRRVYAS
jgi:NAD(P)H dehydrogenase (quinone)